jgi:hypothetical protein
MEVLAAERGLYRLPHPYNIILCIATFSMQMVFFHIFARDRYFGIYMPFFLRKQYSAYQSVCLVFTLCLR